LKACPPLQEDKRTHSSARMPMPGSRLRIFPLVQHS
jgi:hypothetical protein